MFEYVSESSITDKENRPVILNTACSILDGSWG